MSKSQRILKVPQGEVVVKTIIDTESTDAAVQYRASVEGEVAKFMKNVYNMESKTTEKGLISLGWTPPGGTPKCPKCGKELSESHCNRERAWYCFTEGCE